MVRGLRIAPLPPHWFVNILAPHLGISIYQFWVSTFLGTSHSLHLRSCTHTVMQGYRACRSSILRLGRR
jgi:hypothetical protein